MLQQGYTDHRKWCLLRSPWIAESTSTARASLTYHAFPLIQARWNLPETAIAGWTSELLPELPITNFTRWGDRCLLKPASGGEKRRRVIGLQRDPDDGSVKQLRGYDPWFHWLSCLNNVKQPFLVRHVPAAEIWTGAREERVPECLGWSLNPKRSWGTTLPLENISALKWEGNLAETVGRVLFGSVRPEKAAITGSQVVRCPRSRGYPSHLIPYWWTFWGRPVTQGRHTFRCYLEDQGDHSLIWVGRWCGPGDQ